MYSDANTLAGGFPHSDISGSKSGCRLPEAFRRLQRPSSPPAAKASTVCACSLDHIPKQLLAEVSGFTNIQIAGLTLDSPYGCVPHPYRTLILRASHSRDQFAFTHAIFLKNCLVCMKPDGMTPFTEAISSRFLPEAGWWVWVDSNHRPHPYQGCALTT